MISYTVASFSGRKSCWLEHRLVVDESPKGVRIVLGRVAVCFVHLLGPEDKPIAGEATQFPPRPPGEKFSACVIAMNDLEDTSDLHGAIGTDDGASRPKVVIVPLAGGAIPTRFVAIIRELENGRYEAIEAGQCFLRERSLVSSMASSPETVSREAGYSCDEKVDRSQFPPVVMERGSPLIIVIAGVVRIIHEDLVHHEVVRVEEGVKCHYAKFQPCQHCQSSFSGWKGLLVEYFNTFSRRHFQLKRRLCEKDCRH